MTTPNAVPPAPACPACAAQRLHAPDELRAFHRFAGHGYAEGQGWSHPALEPKAEGATPR